MVQVSYAATIRLVGLFPSRETFLFLLLFSILFPRITLLSKAVLA